MLVYFLVVNLLVYAIYDLWTSVVKSASCNVVNRCAGKHAVCRKRNRKVEWRTACRVKGIITVRALTSHYRVFDSLVTADVYQSSFFTLLFADFNCK